MRPILQRLIQTAKIAAVGGTATLSSFFIYTRNTKFTPIDDSDPIFRIARERNLNPHENPTTHDFFIRRVPLGDIRSEVRDSPVKLTEAFCAGVWSNWGFAIQRALSSRSQNESNKSQLWTRDGLLSSKYNPGTLLMDSFEVLEKRDDGVIFRGGDSPSNKALRPLDVILELSATIKEDEQAVDFGFKSVFFAGDKRIEKPPMPGFVVWLHLQYAKLLLENGVANTI
ncbi:hypothetical protein N7532_008249 [Penicillium argentinense]|uniref:Uncharacterized protein n=1 Tax=Penicillium argentinense TaxID=1131581 RepID=A0A9W9K1P2_9EURO|nr:uncharacterized protein N7532_008249 [Penicillium argentinense]KAJ5089565.1 hypothetical protein N7532_008249 [Penicillium argentinense]